MFDIQIYGSGSSGNCVLIASATTRILVDAGLTRKRLLKMGCELETIDALIVTHHHSDHCSPPLVQWFLDQGKLVILSEDTQTLLTEKRQIDFQLYPNCRSHPYQGPIGDIELVTIPQKHHDIINYACLMRTGDQLALYATDLDTLSPTDVGDGILHLPPVDHLLLEGNYDEEWLRHYIASAIEFIDPTVDSSRFTSDELAKWVRQNYRNMPRNFASGLFRAVQNMRHLSKQQARIYAAGHLKPGGVYYELHRSSQFYQAPDDWEINF